MNEMINMLILAFIQGISEWFPISSSGHLVLFSNILGFENNLLFDVALHFGTLMAVFVYFGKDIIDIIEAWLKGQWQSDKAKLGYLIIVASIPVAIIGLAFERYIESAFSSLGVVAMCFAITGIFLIISSLDFRRAEKQNASYIDSLWIGLGQAIAILPGISRSGATMSSGLLRGLTPREAMRFSFLISIPAIFGASILEIGSQQIPSSYILPTLISFIVGLASIHFLLKIVANSKKNLRWFALYVLLLAVGLGVYFAVV